MVMKLNELMSHKSRGWNCLIIKPQDPMCKLTCVWAWPSPVHLRHRHQNKWTRVEALQSAWRVKYSRSREGGKATETVETRERIKIRHIHTYIHSFHIYADRRGNVRDKESLFICCCEGQSDSCPLSTSLSPLYLSYMNEFCCFVQVQPFQIHRDRRFAPFRPRPSLQNLRHNTPSVLSRLAVAAQLGGAMSRW